MHARIHLRSFVFTFCLCLLTTLLAVGYLARWGREDAVVSASVSVLGAVSATGLVANAMTIWRER